MFCFSLRISTKEPLLLVKPHVLVRFHLVGYSIVPQAFTLLLVHFAALNENLHGVAVIAEVDPPLELSQRGNGRRARCVFLDADCGRRANDDSVKKHATHSRPQRPEPVQQPRGTLER